MSTRIRIVETCQHQGLTFTAGDVVTLPDDVAEYLRSVGWAEGGPPIVRDREVTLDVHDMYSDTTAEEQ